MAAPRLRAEPSKQFETDRVIVTQWRFPPGAETGWHRHGYDYIVIPLTTGSLMLESAEGEKTAELKAGQSYARREGVEHNVINVNDFEFSFIEVELKL